MNIVVYCGSSSVNNPNFSEAAKALGRWIGDNGLSRREFFSHMLVSEDLDEIAAFLTGNR